MTDMPIARPYLKSMAAYNSWMNGKIFDAAARLPDDEIARDHGAFFKSILGTLNHLLFADLVWIGRFKEGRPRVGNSKDQLHEGLATLRPPRMTLDREILDWANETDEAWLTQPFSFTTLAGDQSFTFPAWILVAHMFNHQIHHRGQVTTLLSQAGQDVGVTDIVGLPGLKQLVT